MAATTTAQKWARGLAWFGIGLGAAELLMPRTMARAAGLAPHHRLIRLFGAREILTGALILGARDPERATWLRVMGDALDAGLLGKGLTARGNPRRLRTAASVALVSPVVLMDYLVASKSPASRS